MKNVIFGISAAVLLHAIVFLFGGMLLPKPEAEQAKKTVLQDVDLGKEEEKKKEEEPKEKLEDPVEDLKQEMPDLRELAQVDSASAAAPALSNMSLSDLGSALSGAGGGDGGFGGGVGFGSGGMIGGTGQAGGTGGASEMLNTGQLDNKPTPTNRVSPKLSPELRKRLKGKVEVLIVVGKDGSVSRAEVVSTPDPAAAKPCLEAAREWRFQPGTRNGTAVPFKLKLPFRFD